MNYKNHINSKTVPTHFIIQFSEVLESVKATMLDSIDNAEWLGKEEKFLAKLKLESTKYEIGAKGFQKDINYVNNSFSHVSSLFSSMFIDLANAR